MEGWAAEVASTVGREGQAGRDEVRAKSDGLESYRVRLTFSQTEKQREQKGSLCLRSPWKLRGLLVF